MKRPLCLLKAACNSLASLFLPTPCALCQSIVDDLAAGAVCQACWDKAQPFRTAVCSRCGYGFPSSNLQSAQPLCGPCRRDWFEFDLARAYSSFQDPIKEIIHQFKYYSHPSLARPLARFLYSAYVANADVLAADFAIPVPLHKSRERERGYNQSCLLAKHFGKLAGIRIRSDILVRQRPTASQAGLSRRARRLNLAGAFRVACPKAVAGQSILLIDDVFTTGATLNECAKILKRNGAQRVNVLTVARVIKE